MRGVIPLPLMQSTVTTYSPFSCTANEKEELLKTIRLMIDITEQARREGLLSLEGWIKDPDCPGGKFRDGIDLFTHEAIMLIVDGTEAEIVERILTNLIQACNGSSYELMRRYIIMQAILLVQEACNPRLLAILLLSLLGEEYIHALDPK